MAEEAPGSEDKTEQPTARRLDKARERGDLPRSQDVGGALVVLAVALMVYLSGGQLVSELRELMTSGLSLQGRGAAYEADLGARLSGLLLDGFWSIRWIVALGVFVALASAVLNGGISFSLEAAAPKLDKLNPLNGLKRMFGTSGWIALGKNLLKFLAIGAVLAAALWSQRAQFLSVATLALEPMLIEGASLAMGILQAVSLFIALMALLDVPLTRWTYTRRLRMTKQEVKDEMRDSDGRPEVKQRIRRRQREISRSGMLRKVKDADVVIVNPEEFAVALVYDEAAQAAPILLAKGKGPVAAQIKREAAASSVPVLRSPVLARAIYFTAELERAIPEGLYRPVAAVLAYIYQMSAGQDPRKPHVPPVVDVPPEFQFDEFGRRLGGIS